MTVKRSIVGALGAGLLIVGMTACGGDDDGDDTSDDTAVEVTAADTGAPASTSAATTGAAGGGAVAVTIEGFAFTAEPVSAGEPFEVENKDGAPHTFTADDGAFDVEVAAGSTASVDALEAGSYPFHCTIHPNMTGTLDVG